MYLDESILDSAERITLALRGLYRQYGYARYRMGKFEEYDLYGKNKDFLISENVITFTDTDGRLMALKPDVTLSVVQHHRDDPDALLKLCYNENVYRVSKGSGSFREIQQSGVECIGNVDAACLGEMLLLAAKSLALCTPSFVLEVSHLDILMSFLTDVAVDDRAALLKCVSEKNLHGAAELCRASGVPSERIEALKALLGLYGPTARVLPRLRELCEGRGLEATLAELEGALSALGGSGLEDRVQLDFSAVGNLNYYNGILFRGFVEGLPDSVLSGGQYDKLMQKLGRRSRAVGFAVYLEELERLGDKENGGEVLSHA